MEVYLVPIEDTDLHWPKVKDFLSEAVVYSHGRMSIDDVYNSIVKGFYSLWVVYKDKQILGSIVASIFSYPQKTVLNVQFCGGVDFKEWKDVAFDTLRQYAKEHNCQGIQAAARPGWSKIFKDDGCKLCWSTYEISL